MDTVLIERRKGKLLTMTPFPPLQEKHKELYLLEVASDTAHTAEVPIVSTSSHITQEQRNRIKVVQQMGNYDITQGCRRET